MLFGQFLDQWWVSPLGSEERCSLIDEEASESEYESGESFKLPKHRAVDPNGANITTRTGLTEDIRVRIQ